MLNAAGIPAAVIGPNEVAVIGSIDDARDVMRKRTDCEHDELGITDREGTHVALVPVKTLPAT